MGRESYLPLFFGDFLASTYTWDGEEQALYLLLLGYQWTAGPLPAEPVRLAKAVRYDPKRFAKLWLTVSSKFTQVGAGLVNLRLEQHRAHSIEVGERKVRAGKAGAEARWNGRTDAPANGNRIADALRPDANRISSGNGIHPIHPIHPDIPPAPTGPPPLKPPVNFGWGDPPDGCDPQAWAEWAAYKRGQPKAATRTKHANFMRTMTPEQQRAAVDHSIRNQYAGCFAPKDGPRGTHQPRKSAVEIARDATGVNLEHVLYPGGNGVGRPGRDVRPDDPDEFRRLAAPGVAAEN